MTVFVSSIIATFVTIPIFGYIIVFIVSKLLTKKHRKSVGIALDVTTLLLIICVHYLIIHLGSFIAMADIDYDDINSHRICYCSLENKT